MCYISTTRFGNGKLGEGLSTNAFLYLCPLHLNVMNLYCGVIAWALLKQMPMWPEYCF